MLKYSETTDVQILNVDRKKNDHNYKKTQQRRKPDEPVKVSQMKTEWKFNVPAAEHGGNPLPHGSSRLKQLSCAPVSHCDPPAR